MTYREKIQEMISQINKLYNDAEWLRDLATSEEKEYWNQHRGIFYDAALPLKRLDNSLTEASAKRCLHKYVETKNVKVKCNNCDEYFRFKEYTCDDCNKVLNENDCDNCGAPYPQIID